MMHVLLPPTFIFEYTLITSTGRVLLFSVKACADLYRTIYGGVVCTQQVLDNPTQCDTMIPSNEKGNQNVFNP